MENSCSYSIYGSQTCRRRHDGRRAHGLNPVKSPRDSTSNRSLPMRQFKVSRSHHPGSSFFLSSSRERSRTLCRTLLPPRNHYHTYWLKVINLQQQVSNLLVLSRTQPRKPRKDTCGPLSSLRSFSYPTPFSDPSYSLSAVSCSFHYHKECPGLWTV